MSIEKITENVSKLDNVLFKAVSTIHKLEKRLDAQDKTITQLEKDLKEKQKMIIKLADIVARIQQKQEKDNINMKTDVSDIRNIIARKRK